MSYYSFSGIDDSPLSPWNCLVKCFKVSEGLSSADLAKQTGVAEALLSKMVNALAIGGDLAAAEEFAIAHGVSAEAVLQRTEFKTLVKSLNDGLATCNCSAKVPTQVPAPVPTATPVPGIMLDAATVRQMRAQAERVSAPGGAFAQIRFATPETKALVAAQAAARQAAAQPTAGGIGKALPIIAVGALAALMLLR